MLLNPQTVRQQIENMKILYPGLLEDDDAWIASLESETQFEELATQVIRRIEDTEALWEGTGARLDELKARKDRFADRIDSLRKLLFKLMESAELTKLELAEATISVRKGQQQLIGDADAETLPPQFRKVTVTADKTAIKEALKNGETVHGYQLSNASPSLTIRIK